MKNKTSIWKKSSSRIGLVLTLAYISAVVTMLLSPFIGAGGGAATIADQLTAVTTCAFTTSNSAVNFGSLTIGTNTYGTDFNFPYNVVTITDTGTSSSNILISGTNWANGGSTFTVTNTVWGTLVAGTKLTANNLWNPQNTVGLTPLSYSSNVEYELANGGGTLDTMALVTTTVTNSLVFGVNVPTTAVSGTYTSNLIFTSAC